MIKKPGVCVSKSLGKGDIASRAMAFEVETKFTAYYPTFEKYLITLRK